MPEATAWSRDVFRAVIFDLDGTLVQTEKLKAISYARAAAELCPRDISEEEVVDAFKNVVGRSRREVSLFLLKRFDLESASQARMREFGVATPWQAYAQVRLHIYAAMLADAQIILDHRWPHTIQLLQEIKKSRSRIGLATMSHCKQARRVLEVLDLGDAFDFVATRDDVEQPKPDPEIYLLVAHQLEVPASECLVIEDSPAGVEAARAAGMAVIAVTTPFTSNAFREQELLDPRWVVEEPQRLLDVVRECLAAHQREAHRG